jgi:fermentation-respiration switch protein FrsA (DUF1100 family)
MEKQGKRETIECGGWVMTPLLLIEGVYNRITADFSLRFVEETSLAVILYYKGKRVTKPWRIEMVYESKGDPHENANTA